MRFVVIFFIFFPILLTARDNPFVPSQLDTEEAPSTQQTLSTVPLVSKKRAPKIHPQRPDTSKKVDKRFVFNTLKARFIVREDSVYIETKDRLKNHFSLSNPKSIVMDFKSASDFSSKRAVIEGLPVTKIEMGAHGSYYRVVFRLDKSYLYSVKNVKYGLLIKLTAKR